MNEYTLMQARSRQAELTREVGQARRAARMRRPRPPLRATRPKPKPKIQAKTPSRRGSWLAAAIAQLRPGTAERWQAQ
jgi:hypothetical protein